MKNRESSFWWRKILKAAILPEVWVIQYLLKGRRLFYVSAYLSIDKKKLVKELF